MSRTKQEQRKFELAKLAIDKIPFILGGIVVVWVIIAHNPTTFKAAFKINEFSAEIDCEFASDSSVK